MKKLMMLAAVAGAAVCACGYVPEPKPIKTSVEVAALYYPGTPQMSEWEIVERARPEIKPLLGWYDESNPEVIDWQIKWAVEHGISTFFVDWYWWNKHGGAIRLHWVNNYYKAKYRKYLKWAMMWANHNEPGAHSTVDQRRVTQYWIDNYFKTPEYYTIDGKPVVVVWDTGNLDRDFITEAAANGETLAPGEGVKRAFALSEEMARAAGLKGIYWMCMYHGKQYFPEKIAFAKEIGCKGQMIYNFDSLAYHLAPEARKPDDTERRFNYDLVMAAVPKWWELTSRDPAFPLWPMIPTGWDDTPRSYQNARAIVERTPEKFRKICEDCRAFCERKGFNRVVIAPINEWQEGSYIEPNEEFGFGMYDAIRDVFGVKPPEGWPANITPKDVGLGPYDYPPIPLSERTAWEFEHDTEGWYRQPYGAGHISAQNGCLKYVRAALSTNAAIRIRTRPIKTDDYKSLVFRARMTPRTPEPTGEEVGKLYWGTPEQPIHDLSCAVSERNTATTPVKVDGEWHEYTIDLAGCANWRGEVNELWFDAGCVPNAETLIDYIRLERKTSAAVQREWVPKERWRGFNIVNWGVYNCKADAEHYSEWDFKKIAEWGFNFVRIPFSYRFYVKDGDWEQFDESRLAYLDRAVALGRKYGIHVMLNMHRAPGYCVNPPKEARDLFTDPEALRVCAKHWAMLARRYRGIDNEELSFNLLNEPRTARAEDHERVVRELVRAVRAEDPARYIVADGFPSALNPPVGLRDVRDLGFALRGYYPMCVSHWQAKWVSRDVAEFWEPYEWPMRAGTAYGLLAAPGVSVLHAPLVIENCPKATLELGFGRVEGSLRFRVEMEGVSLGEFEVTRDGGPREVKVAVPRICREVKVRGVSGEWAQLTRVALRAPDGTRTAELAVSPMWIIPQNFEQRFVGWERGFEGVRRTVYADPLKEYIFQNFLAPWQNEMDGKFYTVGEWGAYCTAPHAMTLEWMEKNLELFEEYHIGWALWQFRGEFGVLDSGRADVDYEDCDGHKLDRRMLELLRRY